MMRWVTSCFFLAIIAVAFCQNQDNYANADGFLFPGAAERPDKYPLDPGSQRTTTQLPGFTTQAPDVTTPAEQAFNQCLNRCRATSEYNPVCGTDNVQYTNPGRLSCAKTCGKSIEIRNYGSCNTDGVRG